MQPGIGTGSLDLTALRWEPFTATIAFNDLDFTDATLAMQVRSYRDAPSALLTLQNADDPDQGLSVDVETVDGRTVSTVAIRINRRTLEDLLPYPDSGVRLGSTGPVVDLSWDLHITTETYPEHRWLEGKFTIEPGATQRILPANTYTNGATLTGFRNAIAALQSSSPSGKVTVAVMGDSYAEQTIIWNALREAYADDGFDIVGDGWINVRGVTEPTGVTVTRSGFTLWDASDSSAPTYRSGLDGHYIVRSGTGGSFTVAGTIATELRLYYDRSQTGAFRYRVDGGSYTTVTPSGAAGVGTVLITGLALAAHTLEVDTSVSSGGNCVLLGVYSTITAGVGIEFLKAGNSSLQASDLVKFQDKAEDIMSIIGVQLVLIFLGTNDYQRSDSPPSTFASEIEAFVNEVRGSNPTTCFVYITPPDTNAVAVNPLTAYDTAMDTKVPAISSGAIEKFSWNLSYESWEIENAAGNFTDFEHLNAKGAKRGVNDLKTLLLDAPNG